MTATAPIEARCDDETRIDWLLAISADQITRYSDETIYDWLEARREQNCARLRAACRILRAQCHRSERAHARIAAAIEQTAGGA